MNESKRARERLARYRRDGLAAVEGWFEPDSAEIMALLLVQQVEDGLTGGVAEIGVHHGRSFLLLANGLVAGESGVALDLFEQQDRNPEGSGRGDRSRFEENLRRWAPDADVTVLARSSLDVTPADAAGVLGRTRMFSVDGGHTAEITRHDLLLAEASVVDGGVVVLDDLLNVHWLGVVTGAAQYLLDDPLLVPFALSPNKLYLTTSASAAEEYAARLRAAAPDLLGKRDVEFFGHRMDVYGPGSVRHRFAAAAPAPPPTSGKPRDPARALRRQRAARRRAEQEVTRLEERLARVEASLGWRLGRRLGRPLDRWRDRRAGGRG